MAHQTSPTIRTEDRAAAPSTGLLRGSKPILQKILLYATMLKPMIVVLLLFVSVVTAYTAARGALAVETIALLLTTGAMAAGGAGLLNHYLERDLDGVMERTRHRPLASGSVGKPTVALGLGLLLVSLAVSLALLWNASLAFFLLAGAFVYVVVYTIWLKRRSSWNVVIGGLAGSFAVLSGWVAVDSWWQPSPLLMALLLFLWTPAHFWSLAIARVEEYRKAMVPMLPVVLGPRVAAVFGILYALLTVGTSLALPLINSFGPLYVTVAVVAGVLFVSAAGVVALRPTGMTARFSFTVSNLYLIFVFAGMALDTFIRYR